MNTNFSHNNLNVNNTEMLLSQKDNNVIVDASNFNEGFQNALPFDSNHISEK